MYLYAELWRARPAWLSLSTGERTEALSQLQSYLDDLLSIGLQCLGAVIDDPDDSPTQETRHLILWKVDGGELVDLLDQVFEQTEWSEYVERESLGGESISLDWFFNEMIAPGKGRTQSDSPGSERSGWLARLMPSGGFPFEPVAVTEQSTATTVERGRDVDEGITQQGEDLSDQSALPPSLLAYAYDDYARTHSWFDIDLYLERLDYSGPRAPDVSLLHTLHRAHLQMIPYENFDIHFGQSIFLDQEIIFDKIITQRRGGVCYELNALFALLLRRLGFDVTLLSASVVNTEGHGADFEHMPLMVKVKDRWLADVGFGDSFSTPLPIDSSEEQPQYGEFYQIITDGSLRKLRRRSGDAIWEEQYHFTLLPRQLSEFARMCDYHQIAPTSHFTKNRFCSRRTSEGRVMLIDDRLIITANGRRSERRLEGIEEIRRALHDHFAIELSARPTSMLPAR